MLLSDRDILSEIDAGRVRLEPWDPTMLQPSSVDVRLDRYFRVLANHKCPQVDQAVHGRHGPSPSGPYQNIHRSPV